jgi:DNA repair protein RadA/Sms
MTGTGLKEILNPSEVLCSHFEEALSGTAVAATLEGIRAFLIEVQALVGQATYGTPQRTSTGFDFRRLSMPLAVLEKRAGFYFSTKDDFNFLPEKRNEVCTRSPGSQITQGVRKSSSKEG